MMKRELFFSSRFVVVLGRLFGFDLRVMRIQLAIFEVY